METTRRWQLYLCKDNKELCEQLHEKGQLGGYAEGPVPAQRPLVPLSHDLVGGQGESEGLEGHHHHGRQHRHVTLQLRTSHSWVTGGQLHTKRYICRAAKVLFLQPVMAAILQFSPIATLIPKMTAIFLYIHIISARGKAAMKLSVFTTTTKDWLCYRSATLTKDDDSLHIIHHLATTNDDGHVIGQLAHGCRRWPGGHFIFKKSKYSIDIKDGSHNIIHLSHCFYGTSLLPKMAAIILSIYVIATSDGGHNNDYLPHRYQPWRP